VVQYIAQGLETAREGSTLRIVLVDGVAGDFHKRRGVRGVRVSGR